jgi:hypothetical protein
LLLFLAVAASASAQESSPVPSPAVSAEPTVVISSTLPLPSPSPTPAAATPSPTPSLLKKTGVKLQFLPPPMEGTISLGIYDSTGKLVRTLHREAGGDEFVAALDGFITHWDGLDDAGQPLPSGSYRAGGYMVGPLTVRAVPSTAPLASGSSASPAASPEAAPSLDTMESALPGLKYPNGKPFIHQAKVHVTLVSNPLDRDRAGGAELSAGFDAKGSWLRLADGLPLKQISTTPNLKWAALARSGPAEPLVLYQSDGSTLEEFVITKFSNMMAFDCGDFDFTAPAAATPAPSPTP